ncbi:uncharacterized protein PRCAT00001297001 [Priceomyces carsonii]|uniref:uncharacterized protein n=1 Tax=Priceomyces carsonii TaxID=28549 RepID=UPI002ED7FCC3|nr:unnamed protein product [Priceomyces carsonii]
MGKRIDRTYGSSNSKRESKKLNISGGKNVKLYENYRSNKRLSIIDSSDSDLGKDLITNSYSAHEIEDDSSSSLTAVSDNDEIEASKKGSSFFEDESNNTAVKGKNGKLRKSGKNVSYYGQKNMPRKTSRKSYSLSSSEDNESDEEDEEDDYSSSSDGSEVDFVKLQEERKRKALSDMKFKNGLSGKISSLDRNNLSRDRENSNSARKSGRSSSVTKPRFGRRKSRSVLPEDINFGFDFADYDEVAVVDESDEQAEDVGEEVEKTQNSRQDSSSEKSELVYGHDSPLIEVPKLREEEIDSEEDYEIDDNELLATLQADNDMDDFVVSKLADNNITGNASLDSYGEDDEENDPFLREEEKFLVNEFESNGFDDDDVNFEILGIHPHENEDANRNESNPDERSENDIDEDDYIEFTDFNAPIFPKSSKRDHEENNSMENNNYDSNSRKKKAATLVQPNQKVSPNKNDSTINNSETMHNEYDDDDDDDDDEDEDDSYLWNYFFSSDNNSSGSEFEDYDEEVETEFFKGSESNRKSKSLRKDDLKKKQNHTYEEIGVFASDQEYDSGESTDVDLSLPVTTEKNKFGSKVAKEVLSSTADYRPPILGTWIAINTKPFGIIDGLSTRALSTSGKPQDQFRRMPASSQTTDSSDDLALDLDELLNVSEMDDDDENDVKIWRDFNSQKKQVPLGAFRNKSILHNSLMGPENVTNNLNHTSKSNNDFNKRRYSLTNHYSGNRSRRNSMRQGVSKPPHGGRRLSASSNHKDSGQISSKQKRRKASIVEAISEGLRPTKSGLFSEHALADVEELLGDDVDLMSLIEGL